MVGTGTHVNQFAIVSLPQIVQHAGVVQVSEVSHVLGFLELWRVHRTHVFFFERFDLSSAKHTHTRIYV